MRHAAGARTRRGPDHRRQRITRARARAFVRAHPRARRCPCHDAAGRRKPTPAGPRQRQLVTAALRSAGAKTTASAPFQITRASSAPSARRHAATKALTPTIAAAERIARCQASHRSSRRQGVHRHPFHARSRRRARQVRARSAQSAAGRARERSAHAGARFRLECGRATCAATSERTDQCAGHVRERPRPIPRRRRRRLNRTVTSAPFVGATGRR